VHVTLTATAQPGRLADNAAAESPPWSGPDDQQTSSGAFRSKLSAGRLFGVIETSRGEISLTDLGLQVCDPETQSAALVEAFLSVPLYQMIYDKYAGGRLPGAHGIEQEMVRMGIPVKQVQKARRVLMRSATEANSFGPGSTYPASNG
jgi:hypothetical protein